MDTDVEKYPGSARRGAISAFAIFAFSIFLAACGPSSGGSAGGAGFELAFEYGMSGYGNSNIYAAWIEGEGGFRQNLFVCEKLILDMTTPTTLANTAIPRWSTVIYPESDASEVDAVTATTLAKQDFSIQTTLKAGCPRRFTVYFETDQSFDANDWFSDQPALVYAADIDVDTMNGSPTLLSFIGWTANEGTEDNSFGSFTVGAIQMEKRYITHAKSGSDFGAENPDESSVRAVGSIAATVTEAVADPGSGSGPSGGGPDSTTGASD